MSNYGQIANMFGLKLEEEFNIKGYYNIFKFTSEGLKIMFDGKWATVKATILDELILGELEIVKTGLKYGKIYYIPWLYSKNKVKEVKHSFTYDLSDIAEKGLVFETKEEAEKMHDTIMEVVNEFSKTFREADSSSIAKF